jgi:hypothetical protein
MYSTDAAEAVLRVGFSRAVLSSSNSDNVNQHFLLLSALYGRSTASHCPGNPIFDLSTVTYLGIIYPISLLIMHK